MTHKIVMWVLGSIGIVICCSGCFTRGELASLRWSRALLQGEQPPKQNEWRDMAPYLCMLAVFLFLLSPWGPQ